MTRTLEIDELRIELTQKRMGSVRIGVFPDGRVRVSAPLSYSVDKIKRVLAPKLPWIKNQRQKFLGEFPTLHPEVKSGNAIYFLGKILPVVQVGEEGRTKLKNWVKARLSLVIEPLFAKWSEKLQVKPESWKIRQMKTKWGSCNITERKIVFNLELAKHPLACIEYVVAHELIHLIEPSHNTRFKQFMTSAIPNWKDLKEELKQIPFSGQF